MLAVGHERETGIMGFSRYFALVRSIAVVPLLLKA
jgi:hypothetical protein